MKILALESSALVAGVALLEDDLVVAEYTTAYKKTHSQTLLPMLDELKRMVELDLNELDAIAVAAGPGSFTGLRIGCATAKGLGLALQKPVVPVPTVDAMAMNLYGVADYICPLMDARRGQVYTGIYRFVPDEMAAGKDSAEGALAGVEDGVSDPSSPLRTLSLLPVLAQCVMSIEDIVSVLNGLPGEAGVIFLGDGVPVSAGNLRLLMKRPYSYAPATCNRQRAASVALLGGRLYREGKAVDADECAPVYLRPSQAERTRREAGHADA